VSGIKGKALPGPSSYDELDASADAEETARREAVAEVERRPAAANSELRALIESLAPKRRPAGRPGASSSLSSASS
jgi:hypothetical protein